MEYLFGSKDFEQRFVGFSCDVTLKYPVKQKSKLWHCFQSDSKYYLCYVNCAFRNSIPRNVLEQKQSVKNSLQIIISSRKS